MKTSYQELNIKFTIEHIAFSVLNIVFERFLHTIPKHCHSSNSYEIHFISKGRGTLIMDGLSYALEPGTLFVTGPFIEHEQIPDQNDPMSEYCIYLRVENLFSTLIGSSSSSPGEVFARTTSWFGKDSQNISPVMQALFHELKHQYSGYMVQVTALLQQCIIKLIRNYQQKKASDQLFRVSDLSDRKYLITEEYFLYHYRHLSLTELAGKLHLSSRQTERFLKSCYGKTFTEKKSEAKMSVAALMLNDPSLTITAIAEALGYSSLEHFSAAFRNYHGTNASTYRKITQERRSSDDCKRRI